MSSVIEILLVSISAIIFVAILAKGSLADDKTEEPPLLFGHLDLAVALSVSLLFGWMALGLFSKPGETPFAEKDLIPSLVTQGFFCAAVIGYLVFRKLSLRRFFGMDRGPVWKLIGLGILLMIGTFPLVGWITNLINTEPSQEQEAVKFFRTTGSVQGRILLAFMAVVVAPVVEEMVFRGLLYRIFKSYIGKYLAMLFTSILFASIHGNIPTLIPLTILAFALTAGLEWRGSLIVNIAMHATFNAVSLLFMLLTPRP